MDDEELQLLRAKRLAELQGQQNLGAPGNQAAAAEEQKAKEEEFKNHILTQVLSKEARSRLSTISIAKPENGKMLENIIINMARTGQIRSQLEDKEFVRLLEEVNKRFQKSTPTVTMFQQDESKQQHTSEMNDLNDSFLTHVELKNNKYFDRRRAALDSDDEDF